jgi:hypothetical protein
VGRFLFCSCILLASVVGVYGQGVTLAERPCFESNLREGTPKWVIKAGKHTDAHLVWVTRKEQFLSCWRGEAGPAFNSGNARSTWDNSAAVFLRHGDRVVYLNSNVVTKSNVAEVIAGINAKLYPVSGKPNGHTMTPGEAALHRSWNESRSVAFTWNP